MSSVGEVEIEAIFEELSNFITHNFKGTQTIPNESSGAALGKTRGAMNGLKSKYGKNQRENITSACLPFRTINHWQNNKIKPVNEQILRKIETREAEPPRASYSPPALQP